MKQQEAMLAKFMARRQQNNVMTPQHLRKFEQNHPQHPDHRHK
jgi:hypothetical protein